MADNQKIKMQIERGNVNVENKEHFLEEDFESPLALLVALPPQQIAQRCT